MQGCDYSLTCSWAAAEGPLRRKEGGGDLPPIKKNIYLTVSETLLGIIAAGALNVEAGRNMKERRGDSEGRVKKEENRRFSSAGCWSLMVFDACR